MRENKDYIESLENDLRSKYTMMEEVDQLARKARRVQTAAVCQGWG